MSGPSGQSERVVGFSVWHARCRGGAWETPQRVDWLVPVAVQNWLAPKVHQATLEFDETAAGCLHWDYPSFVATDDQVWIISDHANPADRQVLFGGIVAEIRTQFDQLAATVTITANARSWSLKRGFVIYGQHRRSTAQGPAGNDCTWYSGLPLAFNPGGKPNKAPFGVADEATGTNVPIFIEAGPVEAAEGTTFSAEHWTWKDALAYLQWAYPTDPGWMEPAGLANVVAVMPLSLEADLSGQYALDAMARIAAVAGYDLVEEITLRGADEDPIFGLTRHRMRLVQRGAGDAFACSIQRPLPGSSNRPTIRPALTTIHAGTLVEDAASCITEPTVVGGRTLYELALPLVAGWRAEDLSATLVPPLGEIGADQLASDPWAVRYVVGGSEFTKYQDVGRLWAANTDGHVGEGAALDVAALVGEEAGTWPLMLHKPLSLLPAGVPMASRPPYAEISFDAGSHWQRLGGCQLIADRVGLRITAADLRQVTREPDDADDVPSPDTDNLWLFLGNADLKLRVVCCIASPHRAYAEPARRGTAGTILRQTVWLNRGARYQVKQRWGDAAVAACLAGDAVSGESDGTHNSRTIFDDAAQVQDTSEGRPPSAHLVCEWVDPDVAVTAIIDWIGGVAIDLASRMGSFRRAPRVVGVRWDLRSWQTAITLETDREAWQT